MIWKICRTANGDGTVLSVKLLVNLEIFEEAQLWELSIESLKEYEENLL